MEIRPFRGWRYRLGPDGDASAFLAPPYDILSAEDRDKLLARCQQNIVAVDMPHPSPDTPGPERVYRQAARRLAAWQKRGVLVQEDRPVLYGYQQTFRWAGKTRTRRALLAGVRATPLGQDVLPHEQTFPGPKADRLRLTQHTRMQLSPILGFYRDRAGRAAERLSAAMSGPADAHGQLGEVSEKLWVIRDERCIADLTTALAQEPVIIADGHHRYTAAVDYRDNLAAQGKLPRDHQAQFALFALVAQEDSGLLVLPAHRIIRGLGSDFSVEGLAGRAAVFTWQQAPMPAGDDAEAFLTPFGTGAMGFIAPGAKAAWVARLSDAEAMRRAAPDEIDAWRQLDVAVLHTLIVDSALRPWRTDRTTIQYTVDLQAAVEACRSGGASLAVCLRGTALASVEAVARAGASMPHKSTYFYPKLATGWVLKPLV